MKKINRLSPQDNSYTQILKCVADEPQTLYYIGEMPKKRRPSVAIVGCRKPTSYGKEVTERLARDLAARGVVIISGLALGVDSIAHRAALEAGGTTIAVLANGLHRIYPSSHRLLAAEIVTKGGAIVSEYEEGIEPMQFRFLERNRLVSGLADAIVITEAAARSGSLNTAAHALAQGKEIFVVPGNITSPMSAGCNQLLRQGATPLLSADDILSSIAPETQTTPSAPLPLGSTRLESEIIAALSEGLGDGDEIAKKLGADASQFGTALTMLEINGIIKPLGANRWTLR